MNPSPVLPIIAGLLFAHLAVAQDKADRLLLEAEQAREAGVPALLTAVKGDIHSQVLAARGLGLLEDPSYRDSVIPLLASPDPQVRRAAAGAVAQMRAPFAWAAVLQSERDGAVRAAIFEAIGRAKPLAGDAESLLAGGLTDADPGARAGAARGLESLFRLNSRPPRKPVDATLAALHKAFEANKSEEIRELILLTMHAVEDRDSATMANALADPNFQVRRLAVMSTGTWVRETSLDVSPIVRYEALRAAPTCDRAAAAVNDASDHVALGAVDLLGSLKCDAALLTPLVANKRALTNRSWRIRAHALVALATVDPTKARNQIANMAADPTWQARVYVAKAARIVNDSAVLSKLARDENPNVAIAAMTTPEDAVRGLTSDHSGLLLTSAKQLKDAPNLKDYLPQLVAAFNRLTATGAMTVRDPRTAILTRIGEINDPSTDGLLHQALSDRDPAIAALASQILMEPPQTTHLPVPTIPPPEYIRGLANAKARITMHGLGVITVDLLTNEAPVTAAVFARLSEAGKYNGLTFHRIVPNFLIQGGSPGADEYDGRSREFLRDELGFARNTRGAMGISTRGRDTGDAQIYINVVDNFRLDRDYTVFAVIRDGLTVLDRIQEGDVIDRIEILRASPATVRRGAW